MKQKPCRHCELSLTYNGRHYPRLDDKCSECENIKVHREYLKSQRKFIEGEAITTLDELLKQEWVMWYHRSKHIEAIKSVPIRTVLHWLEVGAFHKAIRKESEDNDDK